MLENIGKVTAVALDKTGTLTAGKPQVTDVIGASHDDLDVLRIAAGLETGSSHPLALAILGRAAENDVVPAAVSDGKALGGKGVVGTLDGAEVFLGSPKEAAARVPLDAGLQARIEELEALHATGQEISTLGIGGIEQVLRRIVDRAADLVRVDMAVIMVRHSVLECWIVEAASGQAFDTIRKQILLTEETPFSNEAYETKRPVVVADVGSCHDRLIHFRDEFGAQSYLAVPLLGPHDCIGVLTLLSTGTQRSFSEWDIRRAQQFAAYAAVTIENARLFDALQDLSPGQFRRLLKIAEQGSSRDRMVITREGR